MRAITWGAVAGTVDVNLQQEFKSYLQKRANRSGKCRHLVNVWPNTSLRQIPEVQVFRVFQTGIDELFKLAVDFWHKLGERKLLGEGKLEEEKRNKGKRRVMTSWHWRRSNDKLLRHWDFLLCYISATVSCGLFQMKKLPLHASN